MNYFYDLARPGGFNPMAQMVLEGIEIPGPSEFSAKIKALAKSYYEPGPPALTADDILLARYSISNLLDDLREPRSKWELTGIGTELYKSLADLYLRANGKWLAKNKSIPRALLKADPELQQRFCEAFEELFAAGKTEKVTALTGEILAPHGGFIVDGFRLSASPGARKKLS